VSFVARQVRLLICAVQFLTRLPTPRLAPFEPDWITRAARYYPLAGQLVGIIAAAVWLVASRFWPGLPAAVLAVAAGVAVTGGFHEDGLADSADGLGGGQDPARRLAIMKDSRIGSYGALALVLSLAGRSALLAGLSPSAGALALFAAHGAARASASIVMATLPYAGDIYAAKVRPAARRVTWPEAALAVTLGGWPLLLLGPGKALLALALIAAAAGAMALTARRLIGGITGDVLGAVEQLAEVAALMGAAAAIS
jgi:adenosylcobinamide-GDP ribazoletransferase